MVPTVRKEILESLDEMRSSGLFKTEREIESTQGPRIRVNGREVVNLCSNNYLGLANDSGVVHAAVESMNSWGYGLSSVRFICGTQTIHRELERRMAQLLGAENALLYAACFDANGGLFEPLLDERDAIISDELNHASIIDGARLCTASRARYRHLDMSDLEARFTEHRGSRRRVVCTDGVFSMDGDIAPLREICDLAERHEALVMVDDSHATGVIGAAGRGSGEHWGVEDRLDVVTTTFGKALGGGSGGCTAGRAEIIELLRQRSRTYLFSNSLPPAAVGASLHALEILAATPDLVARLHSNAAYLREGLTNAGFKLLGSGTAIVPVMVYDEPLALRMADSLLDEGVFVVGFAHPVVPRGRARIRTQLSAAHTKDDLDLALRAFQRVGKRLALI